MADINRSQLSWYWNKITEACVSGGHAASDAIERWMRDNPTASIEEIRDKSIEIVCAAVERYGLAGASCACDLFDSVMEIPQDEAEVIRPRVRKQVEKGVRYQIRKLITGSTEEPYLVAIDSMASYYVRNYVNATTIGNVERVREKLGIRDGGKKTVALKVGDPAYARIPTGRETCTYCMMLASRDFAYHSAESAGNASYRGCDCLIVPGRHKATKVAGYDPGECGRLWQTFKSIDESGLKKVQGDAIKLAVISKSPINRDHTIEYSRMVADTLHTAFEEQCKGIDSNSKLDDYDQGPGLFLKTLGESLGVSIDWETVRSKGGNTVFAIPTREELWACVQLSSRFDSMSFIPQDRKTSPDLRVAGGVVEIKTPNSKRKTTRLMKHGVEQVLSESDSGYVCLSLLNVDDVDDARKKANGFKTGSDLIGKILIEVDGSVKDL